MSTDKVFLLLDQLSIGGYRGEIGLFHNSDPFLDKRYLQFARYAVELGMSLRENTNGDVLRNNLELCEQLDGLISILTIGLYDYSTYAEKLAEIEFWRRVFKKTDIRFSMPYENLNPRQFSQTYEWLVKDERMLDVPCQYRRDYLFIAYDGTAVLCCQDDYGAFGLGNVFEDGIDHVMFSAKRKAINDILDQPGGRRKFALCRKCYVGSIPDSVKSEEELAEDKLTKEKANSIRKLFEESSIDVKRMAVMLNELRRGRTHYPLDFEAVHLKSRTVFGR
jgi:MoaA/NifB/PqqE/SkfB family radical SAM enzyme